MITKQEFVDIMMMDCYHPPETFITNFSAEHANVYLKAFIISKISGLSINSAAYDKSGNKIPNHLSLHFNGKYDDLRKFFEVYYDITWTKVS